MSPSTRLQWATIRSVYSKFRHVGRDTSVLGARSSQPGHRQLPVEPVRLDGEEVHDHRASELRFPTPTIWDPGNLFIWGGRADQAQRAHAVAERGSCMDGEHVASGPADEGDLVEIEVVDDGADVGGHDLKGRIGHRIRGAITRAIHGDQPRVRRHGRLGSGSNNLEPGLRWSSKAV